MAKSRVNVERDYQRAQIHFPHFNLFSFIFPSLNEYIEAGINSVVTPVTPDPPFELLYDREASMALDISTAVLSRHEELELQSNSVQSDSKVVILSLKKR